MLVDIEADKVADKVVFRIVANKALDDDDDKKTHHDSGIKSEAQDDPIPDRLKKWALKQKAKYHKLKLSQTCNCILEHKTLKAQ